MGIDPATVWAPAHGPRYRRRRRPGTSTSGPRAGISTRSAGRVSGIAPAAGSPGLPSPSPPLPSAVPPLRNPGMGSRCVGVGRNPAATLAWGSILPLPPNLVLIPGVSTRYRSLPYGPGEGSCRPSEPPEVGQGASGIDPRGPCHRIDTGGGGIDPLLPCPERTQPPPERRCGVGGGGLPIPPPPFLCLSLKNIPLSKELCRGLPIPP